MRCRYNSLWGGSRLSQVLRYQALGFAAGCLIVASICFPVLSVQADDNPAPSASFSEQQRWDIKRQIMSRKGVFLDMANLTDNGYQWSKDVVWEGAVLPENEKWHLAGFLFERSGYKGVWLQYAFTLEESTGEVKNFKRFFGGTGFR